MKLILHIPDDLYEHYLQHQAGRRETKINKVIVDQLERFKAVQPDDRIVLVLPDARATLEDLLPGNPGPSLNDSDDLLARVRLLASLGIGEHRFNFTPAQMEELKVRAERMGTSLEELHKQTVQRMESDYFMRVPT